MDTLNLQKLQLEITDRIRFQKTCKKCFMNGKSCSYQKEIENEYFLDSKPRKDGKIKKAFLLMPFRRIMDEIYRTQFEPHIADSCHEVKRADDVTMTGFVICEKICRQIQESSLIVADLTYDNANVFYELGLASALNKNIAIFIQKDLEQDREHILRKLNIDKSVCNLYIPFTELKTPETRIWNVCREIVNPLPDPDWAKNSIVILLGDPSVIEEEIELADNNPKKIGKYSVNSMCASSIHKAISNVEKKLKCENDFDRVTITIGSSENSSQTSYSGGIRKANDITHPIQIQSAAEIERYIRYSHCVVVCATILEPVTYFWMGFAHGLEKDVIPVTIEPDKDSKQSMATSLPFDVRALWHVYVSRTNMKSLQFQMESIYKIILERGKDTVRRREFWEQVTGSGSVSIFIGSVEYSEANKRHVVGEWDYRTVSEIIGYLNSTKETMETLIHTPIFQSSQYFDKQQSNIKDNEIRRLKSMLTEKKRNAIIVGSADVNDMTDYALSQFANVDCFTPKSRKERGFCGIVGFKNKGAYKTFHTPSVYFQWLEQEYLFSWDDIPGNDSLRLINHLVKTLEIDWAKNAKPEKNDTNKTITVTNDKNSLELKLNKKEDKVILKTSSGKTYDYLVKKENDKLNIYEQEDNLSKERGFYDVSNGEPICENPYSKFSSTTEIDPESGYACLYSHI